MLLAIQTGRERLARRGLAKHDRAVDDLLETGRDLTNADAAGA
jgi:phage shock protein A